VRQASGVLPIRITLLGAPQVRSADGTHIFALPRKTLDVLAYVIFPDDEEEFARNSLRRNLFYLLSSLPTGATLRRLRSIPEIYCRRSRS
jgi:hypothetical protein